MPIARLLALSFDIMIESLHARLRANGYDDVKPSFGFVLLAIRDEPTTTTELASRLGVTKQAVSKLLDAMESARYVDRIAAPGDGRVKSVALTERGDRLLGAVEQIYLELEAQWAERVGAAALHTTRQCLADLVVATHGSASATIRPPARSL